MTKTIKFRFVWGCFFCVWFFASHTLIAAPHKTERIIQKPHSTERVVHVNHTRGIKVQGSKAKGKKVRKVVHLYALESFEVFDKSGDFESITKNRDAIYPYILKLNPALSTGDAMVMAQCLADCGAEFHIDPKLVAAVISVESRFNPRAVHRGAQGLGQLMGATSRHFGVDDPFNPTQNIRATTQYLSMNMALFENDPFLVQKTLASYLLGPVKIESVRRYPLRVLQYVRYVAQHMGEL